MAIEYSIAIIVLLVFFLLVHTIVRDKLFRARARVYILYIRCKMVLLCINDTFLTFGG